MKKRAVNPQSQEQRRPWIVSGVSRRSYFRHAAAKRAGLGLPKGRGGSKPNPNSLTSTRPWEALGISRTTWSRRRTKARAAEKAKCTTVALQPVSLRIRAQAARFLLWRAELAEQQAIAGHPALAADQTSGHPENSPLDLVEVDHSRHQERSDRTLSGHHESVAPADQARASVRHEALDQEVSGCHETSEHEVTS